MNMVLAESTAQYGEPEPEEDIEDTINKIITSRKMLSNASYFAFTATPKIRLWRYSACLLRMATRSNTVRSMPTP